MKKILLFIFFLLFSFSSHTKELNFVYILTLASPIKYQIEIADTPSAQQQGLMYRKHLSENQGMLFIFSKSDIVHMWMKNTFIPLDMLFIDKDNKIAKIQENTTPFNEEIISSDFPVLKVLELNAGQVQKHHIQTGMKIQTD